jgi:uncharacterized protein
MQASVSPASVNEREEILRLLRARAPQLRRRGIRHLGLFGSIARGDAGPGSDVDLLAELDADTDLGFGVVSLIEEVRNLVGRPVGLAFSSRMDPNLRARIARDLIPVF